MTGRRKCAGGCGRWLSDEVSLARGYGPVCAERLGILAGRGRQPPRLVVRPAPVLPEQIPGQVALPLVEHQPTLWSL